MHPPIRPRSWLLDLELAWLRFWRRPARTLVGAWAVIVAAAAVTFVLSVSDGLHDYLSQRLHAFTPALWVEAGAAAPSTDPIHRLSELPGVVAVSRHIASPVLVSSGARSAPARLEGYDLDALPDVLPGAAWALEGRLPQHDGEAAVGVELAASLGLAAGDVLSLASSQGSTLSLTISGLIRAGLVTIDGQLLLVSYDLADRLAGPGSRRGYALGVAPHQDLAALRLEVQRETGAWTQPWYEGRSSLLEALAVERQVMLWISLSAIITAAFSTASVTALRVMEQRYELAILQAVGASTANTLRTVLAESLTSALAGALLGAGLGFTAAWALSRIPIGLPSGFGIAYLPVSPKAQHAVLAGGLTLLSAAVAALGPALRGARMDPAATLRQR